MPTLKWPYIEAKITSKVTSDNTPQPKMLTKTETTQNTGGKYRKAQALIAEHLDLNPQNVDDSKGYDLWKRKLEIYLHAG